MQKKDIIHRRRPAFAGFIALAALIMLCIPGRSKAADYDAIKIYPEHVGLFTTVGSQQFVAFGVKIVGGTTELVNITRDVDWKAEPEGIVTIDEKGLATLVPGKTYGQTLVTCSYPKANITAPPPPAVNQLLLLKKIGVTPSVSGGHGSISPSTEQLVKANTKVNFTLKPDTGYHSDSVTGTCGGTLNGNSYTTNPVSKDCTVVAKFAINQYTVTPSVGSGQGSITPNTAQTVNYGGTKSFTLDPSTGYHINNVTGTCGGTLNGSTFTTSAVTGNCTVIANFAINQYDITETASPTAGGSVNCTPNPVNHGSTSTCTATANTGYTLDTVSGCGAGNLVGNDYTTGAVTADCEVTATFTLNQYDITETPDPVAGGSVSCSPNPVDHDSTSDCTISTNAGYNIDTVSGCGAGNLVGSTYTTGAVTGDCEVTATFAVVVTETATPPAAGGVNCTPNPVNYNGTSSCDITTNVGYSLNGVIGCGGSLVGTTYTTGAITVPCEVEAIYQVEITESAFPSAGGSVSCVPNPVDHGSTSTCTVTVDPAYDLSNVGGCGGVWDGSETYVTGSVTEPCTVIANFTVI